MHHSAHFCASAPHPRAPPAGPTGPVRRHSQCNAFGVDLPHSAARRGTARNNANGSNKGGPVTAEQDAAACQNTASGGTRSASSGEQPKPAVDNALCQEFLRWHQQHGR